MARKYRLGTCAFCGVEGMVTDDHVPPQCIFPQSDRSGLIVVPGCKGCNAGSSDDDEYFKTLLAVSEIAKGRVDDIRDSVRRAVRKSKKQGFRRSLARRMQVVTAKTLGGLTFPHPAVHVDTRRMNRSAEKIIRGLYFDSQRRALPQAHVVFVLAYFQVQKQPRFIREHYSDVFMEVLNRPGCCVKDGVFEYWHKVGEDFSAWALQFFEAYWFIGWTFPGEIYEDIMSQSPLRLDYPPFT